MLELFGRGYVMEHCVSVFYDRSKSAAFQSYIADGLMCMTETIANQYGGSYMTDRYADLFAEREEKTGDEIAAEVIKRAGLIVR